MASKQQAEIVFLRASAPRIAPIILLALIFCALSLTGVIFVPATADDVVILRGAGAAVGALLVFGRQLWPGVFLGAVASRVILAWVHYWEFTEFDDIFRTFVLALAMSLQALIGATLIRLICGFPLRLRGRAHLAAIVCGVVPLTCLIVPSTGIGLFSLSQTIDSADLVHHWVVWWVGDVIAVVLALSVAVLGPWNRIAVAFWKGTALPRFTWQALFYVTLSVAITFLSWAQMSRVGNQSDRAQFETLAHDAREVLKHRLEVYKLGLGGGVGLFRASESVSSADWRNYVGSLKLSEGLFGLEGIGFIEPVAPGEAESFLAETRADGVVDLKIRPAISAGPMLVIKYIEPLATNKTALGLNIAFETNRYVTAARARDTGEVSLTEPITLVQDEARGAGLALMMPVYSGEAELRTVADRRAAFAGLVFSPIIVSRLMADLTTSQSEDLRISIYNGPTADPDRRFYASDNTPSIKAHTAQFRVIDSLQVYGQIWTIVSESTPELEARLFSLKPASFLIGGLSFSVLLAFFLVSAFRREELVREMVALRTRELATQVDENRSIIETAVATIALLDERGHVLRSNDALPQLLACNPQDILGKPFTSLLNGQIGDYFDQSETAGDRAPYRGELTTTSNLGQSHILDVQIIPWKNSDDQRRYTAVMRNITEQRSTADQLRSTQRRLDLALTGAKIGVFDINLRTGTSIVSHTWRELMGYDGDEDIDPQKAWLQRIHPDDLQRVTEADLACIEGHSPRSVSEYRVRMKDGAWHWMRSDAAGEERDADGRASRLIGLQTDITDQRQVDELKRQFVSTVSHELRTPLTSINGSISLLLNAMSDGLTDSAKRMLSIAQKNCDRLILLVNDILDLERLESGPPKPMLVPADISVHVKKAMLVNQPFAAQFGVTYDLVRDAPGLLVQLDDRCFQQIMSNLMSNAAKFSPKGGKVRIAIERLDDRIRVSVTDNGRGIPADFSDRIFKPFSQVDGTANRQTEGTGLGLHIAKRLVEQMDGSIGFVSEPQVSTTFWVTLAAWEETTANAEHAATTELSGATAMVTPRILHVEDDHDFSEVLTAAFGSAADMVNTANGAAAQDILSRNSFDLIILDRGLSERDGSSLLEYLALWHPSTQVVALSSTEHFSSDPRLQMTFVKSRVRLDDMTRQCLALIAAQRRPAGPVPFG
ncbi:CHASE domain-containing protein [Fuscibacter oryzae]|uniref:histidine kinase n=1 Tax=Fuscibacter oryzae TaxID=2803939 RepID=A0A8J7MVU6_9RHOB|nr:CHASE domain-containing protein [Fuscibacter oryzae]MBL4929498.1 CHASE domain-containing protein [Fuscibacter oryzae]